MSIGSYIDLGNFYSVYGISTVIVFLMLLWYFVRSNLESETYVRSKNPRNATCMSCGDCWTSKNHKCSNKHCYVCGYRKKSGPDPITCPKYCMTNHCHCSEPFHFHSLNNIQIPRHHCGADCDTCKYYVRKEIARTSNREGMFPLENSELLSSFPEFQEPDVKPKKSYSGGYLQKGIYSDVPVYVYDYKDTDKYEEWDNNEGIYTPNTRTAFRNVNDTKKFWVEETFSDPLLLDDVITSGEDIDGKTCFNCGKKRAFCLC